MRTISGVLTVFGVLTIFDVLTIFGVLAYRDQNTLQHECTNEKKNHPTIGVHALHGVSIFSKFMLHKFSTHFL